jgi:hypothetical protein
MSRKKATPTPRFGQLPPRYHFALNPYSDSRFTTCPICEQRTRWLKFVLVIHIEPLMLMALNMHCRYCPDCDLLIAHQDQLEAQLAGHLSGYAPEIVGNDYLVLGTLERAIWRQGRQRSLPLDETLQHMADFADVVKIEVQPGGWYPADEEDQGGLDAPR